MISESNENFEDISCTLRVYERRKFKAYYRNFKRNQIKLKFLSAILLLCLMKISKKINEIEIENSLRYWDISTLISLLN